MLFEMLGLNMLRHSIIIIIIFFSFIYKMFY